MTLVITGASAAYSQNWERVFAKKAGAKKKSAAVAAKKKTKKRKK